MKRQISFKNIMMLSIILVLSAVQFPGMAHKTCKTGFYPHDLSDFSTTGASFGAGVMPYYEDEKGEKYVLLGREVNSSHKEWALFSGGSEISATDKNRMEHPLDCAAREFYEEAALHKTLGWDEAKVKEYISKNATEVIARYSRDLRDRPSIIYVVKFQKKQIEAIIEKFKDVVNDRTLEDRFKEKDALAVVKYQDLVDAVKKNEPRIALDKNLPSWFNKDTEDKILMFYMPYYVLRARYAPGEPFRVSGVTYHYVNDAPQSSQKSGHKNYQFLAQERAKTGFSSKL